MKEVEQYISAFDPEVQARLKALRKLFFDVLPTAEESIRYKIPAYKVGKEYLFFAGYKKYIGFYPVYSLAKMEDEILPFRAKNTKHSLHFPHNKPLPIQLIKKLIKLKSTQ